MSRNKRDAERSKKLTLKLSAEDESKLKEWSKAYPDKPSFPETAHRLLESS